MDKVFLEVTNDASLQSVLKRGTRSSSLSTELGRDARAEAHMATSEFILTVLVLYSSTASLVIAQNEQNETTYQRKLPSGKIVTCDRCPPGSHLQKHCTDTQRTVCRPCDAGFYTEFSNYIYDCLPCDWCSSDQTEAKKCTSSSNRVCQCKEGFYWNSHFCQQHTVCQKGYGVKVKGTPHTDTECERCTAGYYAAENTPCVPHTPCKSEEKLLFSGTSSVDNVCVSCNSITQDGVLKLLKQQVIEIFFKIQNTRKLHRICRNLNVKDGGFQSSRIHDHCIQNLQRWLNEATEQEVLSLPDKLHKHEGISKNIKDSIKRIHDEINLCRNTLL
ncbi:tumor necrosis factor receptor superfamily member 6B [Ictalurus punctatus]|uniref:Tumor necrosis factor receptor superfamily member 6B n=1 Tax=Ictalurus punctatus TaxID=7998 RepID=A0A979F7S5_ICTPU|nr:tumor necrosis factor receptor superfamily member 6B [Ictalurus punctatus]